MIWVDYLILALIAVSVIISVVRGFVREGMSLASWVIALWVALTFAGRLGQLLDRFVEGPALQWLIGFAVLLVVTLVLGAVVSNLVSQLVKRTGLSGTDRSIGAVFGAARGILLVAVLVMLGQLSPAVEDPWWRESVLIPQFESIAGWVQQLLPEDWALPLKDLPQDLPTEGAPALPGR